MGFPPALAHLTARGLIQASAAADPSQTTLTMHPGVAEAVLAQADTALGDAVDIALGDFWYAVTIGEPVKTKARARAGGCARAHAAPRPICCARRAGRTRSCLLEALLRRDPNPQHRGLCAALTAPHRRRPLLANQKE